MYNANFLPEKKTEIILGYSRLGKWPSHDEKILANSCWP